MLSWSGGGNGSLLRVARSQRSWFSSPMALTHLGKGMLVLFIDTHWTDGWFTLRILRPTKLADFLNWQPECCSLLFGLRWWSAMVWSASKELAILQAWRGVGIKGSERQRAVFSVNPIQHKRCFEAKVNRTGDETHKKGTCCINQSRRRAKTEGRLPCQPCRSKRIRVPSKTSKLLWENSKICVKEQLICNLNGWLLHKQFGPATIGRGGDWMN